MKDLVARIEKNRFVGREFLLWLWFESVLFETNLSPTGEPPCALWMETRLALAFEKDESLLKAATPAALPEAREALRQGKLPREARLRMTRGDKEYAWLFKADTLALGTLSVPAELDSKKDEVHEVLYERMRLVEELEATLGALFRDFLALRLSETWTTAVLPALGRFAHDEPVDVDGYVEAKRRVLAKRSKKG